MNDDHDLERRLGRLCPADPPRDLLERLHAAEPSPRAQRILHWQEMWIQRRQPWPSAYAGLLAVWALIFVLHQLTAPLLPPAVEHEPMAANFFIRPGAAPAVLGGFSLDRAALLTRNDSPEPMP